jgi:enoyl-CoA hydratase/carnithine racemase
MIMKTAVELSDASGSGYLPEAVASSQHIKVRREGTAVRVMLDRPEKLNALTLQMFDELRATIAFVRRTPEIRVLVISGAGRGFCAGMDLSGELLSDRSLQAEMVDKDALRQVLVDLEALPVAKVAMISGPCAGGGLALALMCDLRYATAASRFSVPELDLGYPYSMNGIPQLVRAVGPTLAADMIYTCRQVPAGEAKAASMLTALAETDEELEAQVDAVVAGLARRPALLVWGTAGAASDRRHGPAADDAGLLRRRIAGRQCRLSGKVSPWPLR